LKKIYRKNQSKQGVQMQKDDDDEERKENLPLNVYLDQFQPFHVIIVDNQRKQNEEYEKYLFSLFQVIDEDYHHQMVMRPIEIRIQSLDNLFIIL
jgi:hypothetical protein